MSSKGSKGMLEAIGNTPLVRLRTIVPVTVAVDNGFKYLAGDLYAVTP